MFGDGRRRPLDRDQRARFRYLLAAHHRGGRITRAARDVGEALLRRLGETGRCDPSHATLAADADCCERTAQRATVAMRDLGLLTWERRLVRNGWRAEQSSNAYELLTSPELLHAANAPRSPRHRCERQTVRGSQDVLIYARTVDQPCSPGAWRDIYQAPPAPEELRAAIAALANRRRVAEQRLLTAR